MKTNLKILPFIMPIYSAWFWVGIWLPFYLRWTDYAGIGFLESSMFLIGLLIEIPTGAFSDLFGKKPTLFLAFFFFGFGNLVMALSTSYAHLFVSVFLMVIGSAFYSGTAEALLYDSLVSVGDHSSYSRRLSRIKMLGMLVMSAASVIGGLVAVTNITYPFFLTSLAGFIGAIAILIGITEPTVDSEKFSLSGFIRQNRMGLRQILGGKISLIMLLALVTLISLGDVLDNVVDTAYAIELGYSEVELGILFAILPLLGALGAYIYSKVSERVSPLLALALAGAIYILTAIVSPLLGFVLGTLAIGYRSMLDPVFEVIGSDLINQSVESKYRATAISSFAMLSGIPYVLLAILVGRQIDASSPSYTVLLLGVGFGLVFFLAISVRAINLKRALTR